MFPTLPRKYFRHCWLQHPELFAQNALLNTVGIKNANTDYLLSGQHCVSTILTNWATSFLDHITHIVRVCAKEQVGWIYAKAVISSRAVVAHFHLFRYKTVVKNPTKDMRSDKFIIACSKFG